MVLMRFGEIKWRAAHIAKEVDTLCGTEREQTAKEEKKCSGGVMDTTEQAMSSTRGAI